MFYYDRGSVRVNPDKKVKRLRRLAARYDIISFDVFDTTLIRTVRSPQEVFALMERDALSMGIEDFLTKRLEVQKAAAFRSGYNTKLSDIYRAFGEQYEVSEEIRAALMKKELDTEIRVCVGNRTLIDWIQELNATGKTVVFTSDMYLEEAHIKALLQKLAPGIQYDRIFVSCEYGATKRQGTLFHQLQSAYPGRRILHIGDSLKADCLPTLPKKNLDCLYLRCPPKRFSNVEKWITYMSSDFQGVEYQWSFCDLSPALWSFCDWIWEQSRQKGCAELFFLAREGAFLKTLFDIYAERKGISVSTTLLYTSRKSMLNAASDLDWDLVVKTYGDSTVNDFLRFFHINSSLFQENSDVLLKDCKFLEELKPLCADYSKKQRQLFMEMLKSQSALCGHIGVIDVGWKGSVQMLLQQILRVEEYPVQLHGLYLGEFYSPECAFLDKTGYLCSSTDKAFSYAVLNAGYVFENLLMPDLGSTIGYEKNNGTVVPVFDNLVSERSAIPRLVQNACVMFFRSFPFEREEFSFSRKTALQMLFRRLNAPPLILANTFGDIPWTDMNRNKIRYVSKPQLFRVYLSQPRAFLEDFHQCGWNSAFCLRLFRLPLPYYSIYSTLKWLSSFHISFRILDAAKRK